MKKLEIQQMEVIEGGDGCALAIGGLFVTGLMAAGTIATDIPHSHL